MLENGTIKKSVPLCVSITMLLNVFKLLSCGRVGIFLFLLYDKPLEQKTIVVNEL